MFQTIELYAFIWLHLTCSSRPWMMLASYLVCASVAHKTIVEIYLFINSIIEHQLRWSNCFVICTGVCDLDVGSSSSILEHLDVLFKWSMHTMLLSWIMPVHVYWLWARLWKEKLQELMSVLICEILSWSINTWEMSKYNQSLSRLDEVSRAWGGGFIL